MIPDSERSLAMFRDRSRPSTAALWAHAAQAAGLPPNVLKCSRCASVAAILGDGNNGAERSAVANPLGIVTCPARHSEFQTSVMRAGAA